jgi:hypothetical protein
VETITTKGGAGWYDDDLAVTLPGPVDPGIDSTASLFGEHI